MLLIGIGGRKRAGKNALALLLARELERRGYTVFTRAFADPLKEEIADYIVGLAPELDRGTILQMMHSDNDAVKSFVRPIMQWHGTEFRRVLCGGVDTEEKVEAWMRGDLEEDGRHWLDVFSDWYHYIERLDTRSVSPTAVLVPDLRMPNEGELIKSLGGHTVLVERPALGALSDTHKSETLLDKMDWDRLVLNDGTLEDLARATPVIINVLVGLQLEHLDSSKAA